MKRQLVLVALTICAVLPVAQAQKVGETVATPFQGFAHSAKGSQLRDQVNDLVALVRAKRLSDAERKAIELQEKFEASFDRKMRQYSFQSKEEYLEFKQSAPEQFEWIDWGYKETLQMKAFIAADKREFPTALSILATIEKIAPASAGTAAERGYILNQLGQPENALAAYKKALSLSTRYQSQRPFQAAALRGIGFALIELSKLDEAEAVFNDSLKIEPANKVALNELAYIRDLRAKR
ncbi:tetratricopeptide repeat protein [Polaromonas sp. JS666]|uniref:tetratricopeptide repeat protein n=1 Tax=Polaromonas sp. (strain JS666 / ATCC BAA-500) TaxID=296591 RepID=UPI00088D8C38|nr:tetratricopeptide repeat protein [Polaromonas sp. JS666]SDN10210.1 Tetratricopeptide repeat-containing protein [Polaromonas sp. JS666]